MVRILLIEDNDSNRDLIARYLELFGYEVRVAVDGQEGWEKLQAEHEQVDVVLLDMNLPKIDGWELVRRLKADEAIRHLPVIALTAHAMVGDREKALSAGCDDYVTKPIDFKTLASKMAELLNKEQTG